MSNQNNSSDDELHRRREFMAEIQRRNEQSAAQRARLAGSPEVGIFWDVNGGLILGAFLEEAETRGRFVQHPVSHEREWIMLQRVLPALKDMEYDDPPRGRVVYDKVTRRFRLYADACILRNNDLMAKIRRQLNLPAEIEVGPDNFYQCKKCLGLSTEDVAGLNAKGRRKRGFVLDRKSYVHHLAFLIMEALWCHFKGQRRQEDGIRDVNPLRDNEVRRIADLQVPSWISIAPANSRFSRARAAEQAIARVETAIQQAWAAWAHLTKVAKRPHRMPDRQQSETDLFSRVRATCSAAVSRLPPERMAAPPGPALEIWNDVSAALTYSFELEIATLNRYSQHVRWLEDQVEFFLERLAYSIATDKKKDHRELAIRTGVNLVLVDRIWKFAITEIAGQLAKTPDELLLPDRDDIEATFFARVDGVCAAALTAKSVVVPYRRGR